MYSLKIPACAIMLILVAPMAAAHSTKRHSAHTGSGKMMCADMHAKMHDHMKAMKGEAAKMAPAMKCMSEKPDQASGPPPAAGESPAAGHNHDHADAPPPK